MSDFIQFWFNCFIDGVSAGKGVVLITEFFCLFLWFRYGRDDEHKAYKNWEKRVKDAAKWLFIILLFLFTIFIAPYNRYNAEKIKNNAAQQLLSDKSPNLDGFIHRIMTADESGTTNSIILVDVSISSLGGMPSEAGEYGLAVVVSTNRSVNAEEINFSDDFKLNFIHENKPWMVDLKRRQLISEKTTKAIQVGEYSRGWLAYRLHGIKRNQYQDTNVAFTFLDVAGKKYYTTNGFWHGKWLTESNYDDFTTVIPGAENIFYPVPPEIRTGWLPPELPPGCSNVIVYFGSQQYSYPRQLAEILASSNGTQYAISDLPGDFSKIWMLRLIIIAASTRFGCGSSEMTTSIGGKTFQFPILPVVVSNRLYVEVEVPFSNEKQKLVMSDAFDSDLTPVPSLWDRNYSTNYDEYGNGMYYYEVVNELTNPVLQVMYAAPNIVLVNGIFKVDSNSIYAAYGQSPALLTFSNWDRYGLQTTQRITTISLKSENFSEILAFRTNDTLTDIGEAWKNEYEARIDDVESHLVEHRGGAREAVREPPACR